MVVAPIAVAVIIGLVAGALRRGRLASLTRTRLRHLLLLAVAVGGAICADVLDLPAPAVFAFVGLLSGITFAASNLLIPGMAVVGIGIAANLVPVALNGSMPVRADALVEAGIVDQADVELVELRGARELADSETTLEIMGDVIPVPPFEQVMSFGDLIVLVGLADVITNLMRARRPVRLPKGSAATLTALGWEVPPGDDIFIDLRRSLADASTGTHPGTVRSLPTSVPSRQSPSEPPTDSGAAPTWDSVSAFSSSDHL